MADNDPYDLARFVHAQQGVYPSALAELRSGSKRSHWMWFIFPQFRGLGRSPTSQHYAIKSAGEARQYLAHPVLGARLLECCRVLLSLEGRSAHDIFGSPDDRKLRSSMTLFESVAGAEQAFSAVLDKYFEGSRDRRTLELLGQAGE
jgi:uncharacterized protein (DUF1810 family)